MDTLSQDLRYALRTLARSRGFAVIATLALALGIGANTAIFSVVNAVLLRPLPYADASRLVVIWNSYPAAGLDRAAISPAEFADYREQLRGFDGVSAFTDRNVNLTGSGEPERLKAFVTSPDLFHVLGVAPALGRGFLADEGREGSDRVAVLSDGLWRRRFAADPGVVGRTVQLNGQAFTVVGVMPSGVRFPDAPSFQFSDRADLWLPRAWEHASDADRGNQYLRVIGRVAPGGTLTRARAEVDRLAARFRAEHSEYYPASSGWRPVVVPFREQMVGDVRPALLVLSGVVGLVLLIACANVANLLLARAAARRKEIAIRTALGATRARVVRQLLTESLLLALAGGTVGLLLAVWGVDALVRLGPSDIPRLDQAGVDVRVLLFTLGASVLTGVLFGLAPAVQQSRPDLNATLKEGGRSATEGGGRQRLRAALVVSEVALALVVLVGAGLLLRSFVRLQQVDPGFRADGVLTMQLALPRSAYPDSARTNAFYRELVERLSATPGVEAAAAVYPLPLAGDGWSGSFLVEGQPVGPDDTPPHAAYAVVTPDYFRTLSIPVRRGRAFSAHDAAGAPGVVVVDETLARRYWPGQDPIGKRVNVLGQPDSVWSTVVGVVGHVRSEALHVEGEPQLYLPYAQMPQALMHVAVRGGGDPLRLVSPVREVVRAIDRDLPVAKLHTMRELLSAAAERQRFNLLLLSIFAAAALLLAAVGIYGIMSYTVAQRLQEIGIRVALGARPRDVLRLVVGQGMATALLGVALGSVAALALSRVMARLLFGIGATDPVTYVGIATLLAAVALVACYLPARRATRVSPVVALRAE